MKFYIKEGRRYREAKDDEVLAEVLFMLAERGMREIASDALRHLLNHGLQEEIPDGENRHTLQLPTFRRGDRPDRESEVD